jgi:long-chain acyl-CoA synthetase
VGQGHDIGMGVLQQFRCPSGLMGRFAGAAMVVTNTPLVRAVIAEVAAIDGEHVLDVGCVDGTPDGTVTLQELEAAGDPGFSFETYWRAVEPDDILTLIYTSGTTGPPKAVEITHAQMLAELEGLDRLLGSPDAPRPGPRDRAISYLPMAHMAERWFTHYTPMTTGMQVTPLADAKALPGALHDTRPTIFGGVPRVWEKLKAGIEAIVAYEPDQTKRQAMQQAFEIAQKYVHAAQAGEVPAELAGAYRRADKQVLSTIRFALGLDQVRLAVVGAAPIAAEILQFILAVGIAVGEVWGMSETSGPATGNPHGAIRIGTVGKPIPGMQLNLASDGELLARGPTVMKGYRGRPSENRRGHRPGRLAAYRRHRHHRRRRLCADRGQKERTHHQRCRQEHVPGQHRNRRAGRKPADRPRCGHRRPAALHHRADRARP